MQITRKGAAFQGKRALLKLENIKIIKKYIEQS